MFQGYPVILQHELESCMVVEALLIFLYCKGLSSKTWEKALNDHLLGDSEQTDDVTNVDTGKRKYMNRIRMKRIVVNR